MNEMKFCQSCGMPLETSEVIGTNTDASLNEDYCIYCFKNGIFTEDVTMEDMIAISLSHMKEMYKADSRFNEKEASDNMKAFFPQLKRWKNKL